MLAPRWAGPEHQLRAGRAAGTEATSGGLRGVGSSAGQAGKSAEPGEALSSSSSGCCVTRPGCQAEEDTGR